MYLVRGKDVYKFILMLVVILFVSACTSDSKFEIYQEQDTSGRDYKTINDTNLDPNVCKAECAKDSECKTYSFSKKNGTCWLKNEVQQLKPSKDMLCGIKKTN